MTLMQKLPIRSLAWGGLALLALLATALAALVSSLVSLAAEWVAGGQAREAAVSVLRLPLPEWLAAWIDPAWIKALQSAAVQLVELSRDALPFLGQGIGLLSWAVWLLWGLFVLGLALAGLKLHLLGNESQRAVTRQSAPSGESVSR